MGKQFIQNRVVAVLFWLKVLFAILSSGGGVAFLCYRVYQYHQASLVIVKEQAKPIEITPESPRCQSERSTLGRLEVPDNEMMIGFHLNWQLQTPQDIRQILGRNPAIINAFLQLNAQANPPMRWGDFLWHSQEIQRTNSIFQLTIEPTDIEHVPQELLDEIARRCLEVNQRGVPMLLRYGHEMNGDWAEYGVRPVTFVNGFRRMAQTIRRYTNLTAMVWAPNVGINYPFFSMTPSRYPTNVSDPVNFRALDTNNDNIIDWRDDPYGPYYPDWVGLSVYWYPDGGTGYNGPVPPTFFRDYVTGTGPTVEQFNPITLQDGGLRNFYRRFAEERNKPMMIPETSAPYFDFITGTQTEVEIKQAWWNQLYSAETRRLFPKLKAIIHFEERKADANSEIRDWRILANPTVRNAFVAEMERQRRQVVFANDMKYECDGSITIQMAQ